MVEEGRLQVLHTVQWPITAQRSVNVDRRGLKLALSQIP